MLLVVGEIVITTCRCNDIIYKKLTAGKMYEIKYYGYSVIYKDRSKIDSVILVV